VNPLLQKLQPYPFEKLRALFKGITPRAEFTPISFGIGEPKHATPTLIREAVVNALSGLATYPATAGTEPLRQAIATWIMQRYDLPAVNAATEVLPVSGSREALFSLAQTVIDSQRAKIDGELPVVVCPNPFYQIYEGAALLAGAEPYFVNSDPARNFACNYAAVPDAIWARTQLLYVCSPGNPTGAVLTLDDWRELFALSDKHGFVIASDECYSEIYFDEATPPLGGLEAAHKLGRGFDRLVMLSRPLSSSNSCSIAPITARRSRPCSRRPAPSRGKMKRTCAKTARCMRRNSRPSRQCSPTSSTSACPTPRSTSGQTSHARA
jgi:N-succinyldiaminopimelate aminotransferase